MLPASRHANLLELFKWQPFLHYRSWVNTIIQNLLEKSSVLARHLAKTVKSRHTRLHFIYIHNIVTHSFTFYEHERQNLFPRKINTERCPSLAAARLGGEMGIPSKQIHTSGILTRDIIDQFNS